MKKHLFMFSLKFLKLHFVSQTKIFEVEEVLNYAFIGIYSYYKWFDGVHFTCMEGICEFSSQWA
jgi:hypothetical protein